jgi:hypothetical protein
MEKDKVYPEGSTRMSLIVGQNDSSGRNKVGSAIESTNACFAHESAYNDLL